MKPTQLVLALLAAIGMTACATSKPQGIAAMQIEPVFAIRHGVTSADAYYRLGRYHQGQGRLAPAEEAYLKAITVDEAYVDAYNALGSLYAERGELKRAAEMFEKVVSLAPTTAYLHNNLGYAYYLQGQQDEAYRSVHKALTLDSGFERAWQNLEKIAEAGGDHILIQALKQRQIFALPPAMRGRSQLATAELPRAANSEEGSESKEAVKVMRAPPPETASLALQQESRLAQYLPPVRPGAGPGRIATSEVKLRPMARVVAVSSRQEVSANANGEILLGNNRPERQAALDQLGALPAEMPQARFEVANANGITGLARRVGATLRKDGFAVSRITNYASYAMTSTVVQYQPGFESAAKAFVAKYNLNARLVSATAPRRNVDVRIVLGRGGPLQGVVAI